MKTTIKTAIVALALAVSVSASAEGYMFNKNLSKGARGADVTALQTKLGVTPATGYFGNVTLAAVKAYQTANGISPVSGFVGPLTRASLNASTDTTTVTPTTPTTPVTLNGQEGFGEYRLSPTPVNDTNIQRSSDVAVYGVEVKAKNADISVERLTLDVSVTGTGSENPATLINKITVKDGSTVLATLPVNTSTFSKYTGTSNYYVQLSGLSTKVAKDTIKTFTVSFDTNSIDTARTVVVNVAANGVRAVDGRGISTYNALAVGSRTHVFKKPGNSTVLVKADATTIYSTNYRVNVLSNGTEKALTSTFAIKSESGASKITSVTVQAATSTGGTMPTNMYLYQGSTLLDARTVPGTGIVTFDIENSNVMVAQDTTSTFTVKVDMPSTTVAGSLVNTSVTNVIFDKADGSSSNSAVTVAGPYHFFAPVVPEFTKVSSTVSKTDNTNTGSTTVATADIRLNVKANGGDILVASTTAVIGLKNTSTGIVVATSSVTGTTDNGITSYADGATKPIQFTAIFSGATLPATGNYKAVIQSVKYSTSTGATWFTLPGGFEAFDTDNSITIVK